MDDQEQIFWEMINFELGETLEYLKDKESVWQHLTDENKALIIQLVSHRTLPDGYKVYECCNCKTINVKRDNGEIRVGFCDECEHPLWN